MTLLDRPIIFIGLGRSGTTIISEIIFQHEDLAWPSNYQGRFTNFIGINKIRPFLDNRLWRLQGQKKQLNKVAFYNKWVFQPTEAYRFWNKITRPEIDFSRNFLLDVHATPEERSNIRDVFEKIVKYQRRTRLAFKITGPGRIGYLHSIFPDAIFIEITREPFANIRSLLKVPFWMERGMHQLWWVGAYSEEEQRQAIDWSDRPALLAALQYKKIRDKTREEVNRYGVEYLNITFEDFVSDPNKVIEKILAETGLRKSRRIEQYVSRNRIYSRNENADAYFNSEDREKMAEILGDYCMDV